MDSVRKNEPSTAKLANENHVVIVDDNPADIRLARWCYERSKLKNPWLAFQMAADFLRHLSEVKAGTAPMPAIVLLDINMPGTNGLELLKETRGDPFFRTLPIVVMLTSSRDPYDNQEAIQAGASGFVTKPGDLDEFAAFFDSLAG